MKVRRRVVDATYLSPTIPATTPAPFPAGDEVRVAPIHELASLTWTPRTFVIVGSGKTATDGIIWLLLQGVPQDRIVWVRPRDPWMLNRATVQPDPVVALELSANIMAAAASADAIDDFFLRLEASGVMLRIDRSVLPTMAKAPTLGRWELELLRTVDRVVRLGHVKHVTSSEIVLDRGSLALPAASLVVHCAASGLANPPRVPVWGHDKIRLQTVRAGFPCFNAALSGYLEAARDDDASATACVRRNAFANTPQDWILMQQRGAEAVRSFSTSPRSSPGLVPARSTRCASPRPTRSGRASRSHGSGSPASRRTASRAWAGLLALPANQPPLVRTPDARVTPRARASAARSSSARRNGTRGPR